MSEPGLLPQSWVQARIVEFARTQTGGTPSRAQPEFFGGGIPWVKSGELGDGRVTSTEETLTLKGIECSSAKLLPAKTLCIALYGATVGKVGIVEIEAATNQAVCALILPPEVHTEYLFYFFQSIRRKLIEMGKGGAQSNISNEIVRQTEVPLAPAAEQRRIVAKIEELFSDLDAGVAALLRVKANLKRYRAAVLKAAVEGRLTQDWRRQHPATEPAAKLLSRILADRRRTWEEAQLRKYKESGKEPPKGWREKWEGNAPPEGELPLLPAGWKWVRMELLASSEPNSIGAGPFGTIFKAHDFRPTGVPIIFLRHVAPDRYLTHKPTFMDVAKWEELFRDYSVFGGELLVTKLGDPPGTACIYPTEIGTAMVTPDVIRAVIDSSIALTRYVVHFWNSEVGRRFATGVAFGTTRLRLTLPLFKDTPIALPPLDEQREIVAEVDRRLSVIDAVEAEVGHGLGRAARLRQAILQRAFEGKLVPQDPADEPTQALLARITAASASPPAAPVHRRRAHPRSARAGDVR